MTIWLRVPDRLEPVVSVNTEEVSARQKVLRGKPFLFWELGGTTTTRETDLPKEILLGIQTKIMKKMI